MQYTRNPSLVVAVVGACQSYKGSQCSCRSGMYIISMPLATSTAPSQGGGGGGGGGVRVVEEGQGL